MIVDAHLHLDCEKHNSISDAAKKLEIERVNAGINHCIVLHLLAQGYSSFEFYEAIKPYPCLHGMVNIDPLGESACTELTNAILKLDFVGLKLHPRLQGFDLAHPKVEALVKHAGSLNVPVLIDAFPDGTNLEAGFSPLAFATLARRCPSTKIIVAHMGGHYVFDFMMLAKRIPNMYFDVSYSLLYYRGSCIPRDMVYAIKSMKSNRIFYGSDYPDRPLNESLELSKAVLVENKLSVELTKNLLGENAAKFFGLKYEF